MGKDTMQTKQQENHSHYSNIRKTNCRTKNLRQREIFIMIKESVHKGNITIIYT